MKEELKQAFGKIDYANPTIAQVLIACPWLNWRRCWQCNFIGLYRDIILPHCACHNCGSADTRTMKKDNDKLYEQRPK